MSQKINFILLYYLIANGFGFSVFITRGIIVSWYVLDQTNSTLLVGLITAIPTMMLPLLSPIGGRLADSVSRKFVFFVARIATFLILILMALSVNLNFYSFIFLIITSIFLGFASSLEASSQQNLLIDILGIEKISKGNGYKELFNSSLSTVLPLIIGALLTVLSSSLIFWVLPFFGFVALFFGYLLFNNFKPIDSEINSKKSFSEVTLKDSLIYIRKNENIWILLSLSFGMMLFWSFPQPLLSLYSRDILKIGGGGYAVLSGLYFAGSMVGSILITLSIINIRDSKILIISALLFSIFVLLIYNSVSPILCGIFILLSGISHSAWWISMLVFLQTISKESYKGRVIGFYFGLLVSVAIGSIIGGLIAEFIGIRPTIYIAMGSLSLIHLLALLSSKFRNLNLSNKDSY